MNAEVYGRRSRGRQKKRWRDKIQEDLKTLKLKKEDADDRNKWRRRIRVADTSPIGGINWSLKERENYTYDID